MLLQFQEQRVGSFTSGYERRCQTLRARCQQDVRRAPGAQTRDALFTLSPFGGQPLGLPALSGQLPLQLRAADRQRALLGGVLTLLDQPAGPALGLGRLGELAL